MAGEHWFDALTRALATRGSRKAFLKLAGAGAVGLLVAGSRGAAARESEVAASTPCGPGGTCPGRAICLGGNCCPFPRGCKVNVPGGPPGRTRGLCCNEGSACVISAGASLSCCPQERFCQDRQGGRRCCPSGSTCQNGRCVCRATGREACGNACCPSGKVCEDGRCVGCPVGQERCNRTCCRPGESCQNGRCVRCTDTLGRPSTAPPGSRCTACCANSSKCCVNSLRQQACVDLLSNTHQCGSCDNNCAPWPNGQRCRNGRCYCPLGGTPCRNPLFPDHTGDCCGAISRTGLPATVCCSDGCRHLRFPPFDQGAQCCPLPRGGYGACPRSYQCCPTVYLGCVGPGEPCP